MMKSSSIELAMRHPEVAKGWYGVDLDGTLAHYDGWRNLPLYIGPPVLPMLARVKRWVQQGKDVRIFTARCADASPAVMAAIQAWCRRYVGLVLPITNVKDHKMIELWDDRAIQVIRNTGKRADGRRN